MTAAIDSQILVGDCRAMLRTLPAGCAQTCVTSPPYFGLRDYGCDGQIGLEATPAEFVETIVDVFREIRRVLADDGTLWLNLGDSYVTNPRGPNGAKTSTLTGSPDSKRRTDRWAANGKSGDPKFDTTRQRQMRGLHDGDLKHKDMIGIPWMTAFALRADGWWLRMDNIWSKENPMPESVADRPTKSHEYLFLLSKSADYYYDRDAIRTPLQPKTFTTYTAEHKAKSTDEKPSGVGRIASHNWAEDVPVRRPKLTEDGEIAGANKRSVWTVATQPYDGAHFATFPPKLIEPCILAGSRVGDIVLDPFFGSGTTGMVAEKHGRRWIGIDINPKYAELAAQRTAQRTLQLGGKR